MPSMEQSPSERYADAAAAEDDALDRKLTEIRVREDRHDLTVREAADLRIIAMETHLTELRRLRVELAGETEGDSA